MAEAVRVVGSQTALALQLGKSQQTVFFLCTRANGISAHDAIAIHRITVGQVPASLLRPDLWRCLEHVPADLQRSLTMPAYCHDDRPPLFAGSPDHPENGRQRLPDPSSPPWVNSSTPPAEFYRPIFCGADRRPRLAFVGAVPPMDPDAQREGEP